MPYAVERQHMSVAELAFLGEELAQGQPLTLPAGELNRLGSSAQISDKQAIAEVARQLGVGETTIKATRQLNPTCVHLSINEIIHTQMPADTASAIWHRMTLAAHRPGRTLFRVKAGGGAPGWAG
jgi:hypothetical protein